MATGATTYYPELPFDDEFTPKPAVIRKRKTEIRATDSEGRFTIEPPALNPAEQQEAESRRQHSVANRLRQQEEKIRILEAEIKKLRAYG